MELSPKAEISFLELINNNIRTYSRESALGRAKQKVENPKSQIIPHF